ncbi:helix-turn-helix domain-containing protein, partial [Mycobacteroides abscessus]
MVAAQRVVAAQRIGKAILARRAEKGLSQRDLAQQANIRQGTLGSIERGETYPQPRTRVRIESVLEWSLGTLEAV